LAAIFSALPEGFKAAKIIMINNLVRPWVAAYLPCIVEKNLHLTAIFSY